MSRATVVYILKKFSYLITPLGLDVEKYFLRRMFKKFKKICSFFRRNRLVSRLPQNRIQRREHRVLDRVRRLQVHQQGAEARSQSQEDLLGLCGHRRAPRSQPGHRDTRAHGRKNTQPFARHVRPSPEANHRPHGKGLVSALPRVRPVQKPHFQ